MIIVKLKGFLLFLLAALLLYSENATATHNRAGEITYVKLSTYTYSVKIVTYTKTSSPADRPELEFWWGDGSRDTIPRLSIDFNVGPDIQRNIYVRTHVYPGTGSYIMYFLDENRNANVINIPGSVNIPFYVQTQLIISPAFLTNSSPQLLQPPIDDGAVNRLFIHNPNAYDPDGDSLSYELVPCKGFGGSPIPTFFYPPASTSFTLDAITGDLIWDSPMQQGEFNVAMIIREWRNIPGIGLLNIGYVTRDMQITIYPPINDPPVFSTIIDTCVEAGNVLAFTVSATDITSTETITLTAKGGPFEVTVSPANFTSTPNTGSTTGDFTWNTNCAHVRKAPYTVVFKAEDNNAQIQLADLESMFITVVGPSPKNPTSAPLGSSLILNWDQSACTEAVGYHIYRRIGSYGFIPSYCETGVPAYTGYVRIGSVNGLGTTTFTDNNNGAGLAIAVQYCYMVTAFYPDGAESYASVEFCNRLNRDLPVITNVDVNSTDAATGQVYVAWGKPVDIDPTQMPGPYRYELQRADASGNFVTIATFTDLNDTTFNDNGLNTTAVQYRYRVQFWNDTPGNVFSAGFSQIAYSVYLSIAPGDEKNNLGWNVNVPWTNTQYVIYRENAPGVFDSIGFTSDVQYVDDSLNNGQNYCYYVKSVGAYQDTGLVDPIINKSQIFCSTPVDNEPPCPPLIANGPNCPQLKDTISWQIDISCAYDIASYQIYYAPAGSNSYSQVGSVPAGTFSYIYSGDGSIAGCYYITATDSTGNESDSSNIVCTESCPDYVLPNIFTPDGNFINDIYHPILPYRDVKDVEMTIFNRWGDKIFETTDPDINWNGKRNNDGEESPDGVYFYVCKVNEIRLSGAVEQRVLKGIIHLTRGPVSK
ncbi:MAG: gliding motility-associated C-terminal domain-containing protein [Bacteroidetes bacterium]|nr:gliding motility-associated C-terminal domain-containing protein [Bacteroidota bacterium]